MLYCLGLKQNKHQSTKMSTVLKSITLFCYSYIETERYSSSARDMTVILKRATDSPNDEEYMDVSFYFHDGKQ